MGGQKDRRIGLHDLGKAMAETLGVEVRAPEAKLERTVYDSFYSFNTVHRLKLLGSEHADFDLGNEEKLYRVSATIADVLRMQPKERKIKKLKVVVSANTDENNNLQGAEQSKVGKRNTSHVTVVYPLTWEKDTSKLKFGTLRCSDFMLFEHEGIGFDDIIRLSDETQPEYTHEMQRRAIINIKSLDTLISGQKDQTEARKFRNHSVPVNQVLRSPTTQEMEQLNSEKSRELWQFFQLSSQLEETDPHNRPLYSLSHAENRFLVRLTMFGLQETSFTDRMRDRDVLVELGKRKRIAYTNINLSRITSRIAHWGGNIANAPEHLQTDFQIWQLLQDPAVWARS